MESTAPYAVTVLRLSARSILAARKRVTLWLERLRASEENDFWPGYVQAAVEMDPPAWMQDEDDAEEESAA